ncbi:hypothetical protein MMC26_000221, partial [Xylographa opegraphella]|nr:hypothetical protein [Xylographa opegraphella]
AWNLVLSKELVPAQIREVSEMFADDDYMESRQFTTLHKATLNIISRTVISELESTTSALNAVDANKRTPLSWAVARRDYLTTQTLLDHGADPNLADSERRPPLYHAIKNGDIPSVELMLSHGARTDLRDAFGGTALHIACKNQDNVQLLDAIMATTHEINTIDDDGDTPLMYAARRNHWRSTAHLISEGAALDLVNVGGDSATAHSIITHSYDVLRELLRAGASTDLKNSQGHTMTDLALQSGDPQIMELFAVDAFYDAVQEQSTEDR